jgi:hypothetical protein
MLATRCLAGNQIDERIAEVEKTRVDESLGRRRTRCTPF